MNYHMSKSLRILSILIAITVTITMLPLRAIEADSLTHGEYSCSPLSVAYDQNSTWGNNTQGQYTVTNNSTHGVTSWSLLMTFADEVTVESIWNVNNTTTSPSSQITVTSNTVISAGSTVSFGMIVSSTDTALQHHCQ